MSKDTFCGMPFTHLNIKNEGKLSACWRYPDKVGDFLTDTLTDTWNGEKLKQVRKDLLSGVQHASCKSCWDLERSGAESLRQRSIQMYNIDETVVRNICKADGTYPLDKLTSIEIRFDNICNLMCRHCSPVYSSVWEQAVKKDQTLMDEMVKIGTYRKLENHVSLTQEVIDEVGLLSPSLSEIMITGGEPLYHSKHYDFLEKLLPEAHHITLQYNSNFSTLEYKGKSILDLWKEFEKVSVRVSLDAYPEIYDYVRVRGNLEQAENNIKLARQACKNLTMSATCTASLLNVTRLSQIANYYHNTLGMGFHSSLVQYPRALNPKLLPKKLKEKVTKEFEDFAFNGSLENIHPDKTHAQNYRNRWTTFGLNVINYMNGEDWHEYWPEFIAYTKAQDNYHKTNILDYYPEFEEYWQ